jgi:carbonic anhydrase
MKFDNLKKISIQALLILGLIEIILNTHSKTHSKSKTHSALKSRTHSRKSESMMDYLNSFFSDSSEEKIANFGHKRNRSKQRLSKKSKENYDDWQNDFIHDSRFSRFVENDSDPALSKLVPSGPGSSPAPVKKPEVSSAPPAESDSVQKNNTESPEKTDSTPIQEELLQDWFEISSEAFKSPDRFPPVKLLDGTSRVIQTDENYFRINSAADSEELKDDKPPTNKFFWFRLSGLHLYYTSTKSDINVLGAVSIGHVNTVDQFAGQPYMGNITYCMSLDDIEHTKWKVCNFNKTTVDIWACRIKKYLHIDDANCYPDSSNATTIVEKKVTQPIIIIPLPSRQCNEDWNYQRNGENWECECQGKEQSPIDLPNFAEAIDTPVKPLFQYEEISKNSGEEKDESGNRKEPLKIILEDNMIKIKHQKFGKLVTMDGAVYFAQEIQIHTPAEHTINGKIYDMEIQILHRGMSKGDLAKSAILCFLVEKVPGVYNKFIDDLDFFNLPNLLNKEKELNANIFIPKLLYEADDNLVNVMKPFSFYTYQGSLTSPPCLESTIVYVASNPIRLGSTALKLFQEAIRIPDLINNKGEIILSNSTPMSNRNTQPLNGRPVFFYDHVKYCGPDPVKPPSGNEGHYEKIIKPMTNYFYVNGEDPSGLPGSFVVSEKEAEGSRPEDYNSPNYTGPRY